MKYLNSLLLMGIFLGSSPAFAQHKVVELKAPSRMIKTDTAVVPQRMIAGLVPEHKPFAGVPLAGQKEYFGDKTEYVNNYVRQYLGNHTKTLSACEGRGHKKFSLIDNVLKRQGIPTQLKYLAVIESALNNQAVSPVGAVGPWQLMESTARMLGLKVNGKRDERTDWFKSTQAAAKYLNTLHGMLGDWLLVVAAYNSGPSPILRAIQKTGSKSFWDLKKYLPRETQGHVLAFVATASIFEKMKPYIRTGQLPDDFRFGNEELAKGEKVVIVPPKPVFTPEELASMAIVRISEPLHEELLLQELGLDKKQFEKWNPDYDLFVYNDYSEPFYRLRIPKDMLESFIAKKNMLDAKSKQIFTAELL